MDSLIRRLTNYYDCLNANKEALDASLQIERFCSTVQGARTKNDVIMRLNSTIIERWQYEIHKDCFLNLGKGIDKYEHITASLKLEVMHTDKFQITFNIGGKEALISKDLQTAKIPTTICPTTKITDTLDGISEMGVCGEPTIVGLGASRNGIIILGCDPKDIYCIDELFWSNVFNKECKDYDLNISTKNDSIEQCAELSDYHSTHLYQTTIILTGFTSTLVT